MISMVKNKGLLALSLSLFLVTQALQPMQAQDAAPVNSETQQVDANGQPVEAVNDRDLQPVVASDTADSTASETDSRIEMEQNTDALPQKVYLPVIQSGADQTAAVVAAFQQAWLVPSCSNVLASETGLWDDMPGAGVGGDNNEAGLLWFITNSGFDEKCTYAINTANIATNSYPQLRVRVAINDGAIFKVQVFDNSVAPCANVVATITSGVADDDSQFRTYSVNLPANKLICKVQMTLDDDANDVASLRASALIDFVRIWNANNNTIGWNESFARAN